MHEFWVCFFAILLLTLIGMAVSLPQLFLVFGSSSASTVRRRARVPRKGRFLARLAQR